MTKMTAAQKREMEVAARREAAAQNFLAATERMRAMPVVNTVTDCYKLREIVGTHKRLDDEQAWALSESMREVERLRQELERTAEEAERFAKEMRDHLATGRTYTIRQSSRLQDAVVTWQRLEDAIKFGEMVARMSGVHVPMFRPPFAEEKRALRLALRVQEMPGGTWAVVKVEGDPWGEVRVSIVTEFHGNRVGDENGRFLDRVSAIAAMAQILGERL